jgi:membrane protein
MYINLGQTVIFGRILRHERKRPILKGGWQIPQKAFVLLRKNDPLRMAGATAFFTSFSLPFILIILIKLFGLVLNPGKLSDHLFRSLSYILGHPGVRQIRDTLQEFQGLATNGYIAAGGFVFLLFVVTTLFKVIKDSVNQLWEVQIIEGRLADTLLPRLRAILLIVLAGLFFLLDLGGEAFLVVVRDSIGGFGLGTGHVLYFMLRQLISFVIFTGWIAVLFLYLPDGRFSFGVTCRGALLTGALFTGGKFFLGWLLVSSNIKHLYGAAGSFVLVLLFLFYISLILYYGAAFTAAWAAYRQDPVRPASHARRNKAR